MMYQHLRSTHDVNGNPRRLYVIYSEKGDLQQVIDEGYNGVPRICRGMVELPSVEITPSQYKRFLSSKKVNW